MPVSGFCEFSLLFSVRFWSLTTGPVGKLFGHTLKRAQVRGFYWRDGYGSRFCDPKCIHL